MWDILEGHEAEPFRPPGLAVDHDRRVGHLPVVREELLHGIRRRRRRKTTDEETRVTKVLFSRNGTLRVDLRTAAVSARQRTRKYRATYRLAIQEMLANDDGVHGRWILERQEREAARAPVRVTHNRDRVYLHDPVSLARANASSTKGQYLAELREVILQTLCLRDRRNRYD